MPLISSAAPARTRATRATATSGASPKMLMAGPQAQPASAMARPYRRTRVIQPLGTEIANAPIDGQANISPTDQLACSSTARKGNRAAGEDIVIAARSAREEP